MLFISRLIGCGVIVVIMVWICLVVVMLGVYR